MQLYRDQTYGPDRTAQRGSHEDRLVQLAKRGSEEAFAELHRMHSTRVSRVIQRIVKNAEDREDATQDTFIQAFVHLKDFDGRAKFSTWLTRIALNTSFLILRKRKRRSECSIDRDFELSGRALELVDPAYDPEQICLRDNWLTEVRDAIARLPESLRQPTVLRCSKELPVQEIATLVGLSLPATKSRLVRATIKHRTRLNAKIVGERHVTANGRKGL